jgi:hypothetical protein
MMDVAIIVSSDTDLCEVARVVHSVSAGDGRRVSVEATVVTGRKPVLLRHYDFTHNLEMNDFQLFSDTFDYDNQIHPDDVKAFVDSCHSSAVRDAFRESTVLLAPRARRRDGRPWGWSFGFRDAKRPPAEARGRIVTISLHGLHRVRWVLLRPERQS